MTPESHKTGQNRKREAESDSQDSIDIAECGRPRFSDVLSKPYWMRPNADPAIANTWEPLLAMGKQATEEVERERQCGEEAVDEVNELRLEKERLATDCAMKDFVISVLEDALSTQQDQIEALLAAQSNTLTAENAQLRKKNAVLQKRLEKAKADVDAEKKIASRSAAKAQKSEKDLIALQHHIAQALDAINFQQTLIQHA
ncbi:hypothetical protein DFH06DRAFT_1258774 [Mycena polygramma]|nr:hypothetical protein DFH06DRAFT_1258774 [Mycena polygramma]